MKQLKPIDLAKRLARIERLRKAAIDTLPFPAWTKLSTLCPLERSGYAFGEWLRKIDEAGRDHDASIHYDRAGDAALRSLRMELERLAGALLIRAAQVPAKKGGAK